MEWLEIAKTVATIVATIGGVGGFIALYKAKAEKTGIDIDNMQQMLNEAHKMYDDARAETKELRDEFSEYKKENMEYIREFKERFASVEDRLEATEKAVYQGYRCPFPPKQEDCPVLQEYNKQKEKTRCEQCSGKNN